MQEDDNLQEEATESSEFFGTIFYMDTVKRIHFDQQQNKAVSVTVHKTA